MGILGLLTSVVFNSIGTNTNSNNISIESQVPCRLTGSPDQVASGWKAKTTNNIPTPTSIPNTAKRQIKFATWNIRTLLQPGGHEFLSDSLEDRGIQIACIQETRKTGTDTCTLNNTSGKVTHKLFNSGYEQNLGRHGVAIAIHHTWQDCIIAWKPISPRLCYMRLSAKPMPLSIICAHAPTDEHIEQNKDDFYKDLLSH